MSTVDMLVAFETGWNFIIIKTNHYLYKYEIHLTEIYYYLILKSRLLIFLINWQ